MPKSISNQHSNHLKRKLLLSAGLVISLAACSSLAFASSLSAKLNVSAIVPSSCKTVTTTALSFGSYDATGGVAKNGTATIAVTCTNGTQFDVKLDGGNSGNVNQRKLQLAGGSGTLNYNLYTDSNHSNVWGNTSSNDVTDTGTGAAKNETVYGQIAAGQNTAKVGAYSDVVNVTVDY